MHFWKYFNKNIKIEHIDIVLKIELCIIVICIKFHISLSVCLCLTILHRDVPYFPSIFFIILKIKTNCWQTDVDGDTPPPQWLYHGRLQSYLFGGYESKNDLKYLVYLIKTPQSGTLVSWGFFSLKKTYHSRMVT